jgi:hypothetical protein
MNGPPPQRPRTPTKGWHEIASGEIGNVLNWQPGYGILEAAESTIGRLENIPAGDIDWHQLLRGLPRFESLPEILRRRSFSFVAWGEIPDFSVLEGSIDEDGNPDEDEDEDSWAGNSVFMWLSMKHDNKRRIFKDFEVLTHRLDEYPPIARFR